MSDKKIVSVQFSSGGRSYDFFAPADLELDQESYVVVSTVRGLQLGKVTKISPETESEGKDLVAIERVATDEDRAVKESLTQKEDESLQKIGNFLRHSRFQDVKAINVEYSLDSARVTLYLNYDSESNFDIKGFLREASHLFRDSRIEVRQVGPRDMAKSISGLGACGIEKRCCSRFLKDFSSISIKMAKAQDISLTPNEITGICGRLRCCLAYEYPTYEEYLKGLPKKKKLVQTPLGEGKVVQIVPLAETVVVHLPELGNRKFTRVELETGVMTEKAVEPSPSTVFEEQHSDDVEILKLAPIPEGERPSSREGRPSRGRSTRRTDRRQPGEKPDGKASSGSRPTRAEGDNQRSRGRRSRDDQRQKAPAGQNPQSGKAHEPRQSHRRQPGTEADQNAPGQTEQNNAAQNQRPRRPRREWTKKN